MSDRSLVLVSLACWAGFAVIVMALDRFASGPGRRPRLLRFLTDDRGAKRVLVPPVAFSQALINLVDNAVESGGRESEFEIVVQRTGMRAELAVQDRGSGWPEVVRRHLGEPFVTTKPEGVGLGLYYVHSLAEAIGAELTLADREFGGAVARISLPIVPVAAPGEGLGATSLTGTEWSTQNG